MIALSALPAYFADAASIIDQSAKNACANACTTSTSVSDLIGNIANVLVFIVGSVSVIMIIIGGLRYVLSQGNPAQAAQAKNTILYSVIGIVVAMTAYAIVTFVTKTIK
ncbi:MAG TPA: pilin [Candidatus Saccharimonadia bacterium]